MKVNKMLLGIILGSMMSCGMSFASEIPSEPRQTWSDWAGEKAANASEWVGYYAPQWAKNIVNKMNTNRKTTLFLTLAAALGFNVYYNPDGTVASLVKSTMEYGGKKVAEGQEYFTEGAGADYLANAAEGGTYLYERARSGLGAVANYAYGNKAKIAATGLVAAGIYTFGKRKNLIAEIMASGYRRNESAKEARMYLWGQDIKTLETILADIKKNGVLTW